MIDFYIKSAGDNDYCRKVIKRRGNKKSPLRDVPAFCNLYLKHGMKVLRYNISIS